MNDPEFVVFLQWALPRLRLRWAGFRRVRGQVRKRVGRRIVELGLTGLDAYRRQLDTDPREWQALERMCRITISRFGRDRGVFEPLGRVVLPELARRAITVGRDALDVWSAGCASGEEPYGIVLLWERAVRDRYPALALHVTATDSDERLLERARAGLYPESSLRDLPEAWVAEGFDNAGDDAYRLKSAYRGAVEFLRTDVREAFPARLRDLDLILCRNLAFTYFEESLQREMLGRFASCLRPGGALVIGAHEMLPAGAAGWNPWPGAPCVHRPA